MKLLFRSLEEFKLADHYSDFPAYVRVETDGETLFVTFGYQSTVAQVYPGSIDINLTLKYNGYTRVINAKPFGEKQSVTFPYDDNVKTLNISGMYIYYDDTEYTDGKDFTWRTSFDSVLPEVTSACPGPRYQTQRILSWNANDPLGRPTACVGLIDYYNRPDEDFWTAHNAYGYKVTSTSLIRYVSEDRVVGTRMYYALYVGVYETADDAREDYIALVEVISPMYTVSYDDAPCPPFDVQCKTPVVRAPSKVTWQYIDDTSHSATKGFELERSLDGGDFALIYAGTSTSFTDTIPSGTETVQYRVRAVGRIIRSYYATGELLDTILSNIYVGVNGEVRLAAGLYIGENGAAKQVTPLVEVGRTAV